MQEVSLARNLLGSRMSVITRKLVQGNSFFQEKLNREESVKLIVKLFNKFSDEESKAIPDNDLTSRIKSILMIEAVGGTLNDLTPEQREIFHAAVLRK